MAIGTSVPGLAVPGLEHMAMAVALASDDNVPTNAPNQ
jgi:hypothetical protein